MPSGATDADRWPASRPCSAPTGTWPRAMLEALVPDRGRRRADRPAAAEGGGLGHPVDRHRSDHRRPHPTPDGSPHVGAGAAGGWSDHYAVGVMSDPDRFDPGPSASSGWPIGPSTTTRGPSRSSTPSSDAITVRRDHHLRDPPAAVAPPAAVRRVGAGPAPPAHRRRDQLLQGGRTPDVVVVEASRLAPGEVTFHHHLYDEGLREFAVANGCPCPGRWPSGPGPTARPGDPVPTGSTGPAACWSPSVAARTRWS